MDILQLNFQPPYDDASIDQIAQKQLQSCPIPHGYHKQLRHHLQSFPHDYLFQLIPHEGAGFGLVKCLEPGCSSDPIVLHPRTSKPDGGRSTGVGGLAEYQSHILEHELHETMRDRRIRLRQTSQQPQRIRQSPNPASNVSLSPLSVSKMGSTVEIGNGRAIKSTPHVNPPVKWNYSAAAHLSPDTPSIQSPIASSKRALDPLSSNPVFKKLQTGAPDFPYSPSPDQKPSIFSQAPVDFASTNTPRHTNENSHFDRLDSSDSDVHVVPVKSNGNETSWPVDDVSIPDSDEAMVWVDGEGLVPLRRLSKPQSSGKRLPGSHLRNSIPYQSPLSNRSVSPTKPQVNTPLSDLSSPRKRQSLPPPTGLSGQIFSPVTPSHAIPPSFNVENKPYPAQLSTLEQYLARPSAFPNANPTPIPQYGRIDPALLPLQSSSPSPSVASKVKRESTPALTPIRGSGHLDVKNVFSGSNRNLPDVKDTHAINNPSYVANLPATSQLSEVKPDTQNLAGSSMYDVKPYQYSVPPPQSPPRFPYVRSSMPDIPPEIRQDELQAFYKRAVEGIDFCHNATVAGAREALGISEDPDARMDGLSVMLMPHQIIGVDWMIKQENDKKSGGILADEMGLGKTIQMVATMVKNRSENPKIKSTLVLAPLALLTQWQEEIADKVTCDLKVLIYHQSFSKPTEKKKIASHDVVITTCDTLSSDWDDDSKVTSASKRPRGLFKIDWYRVVIDEAQIIRNPNAKKSRAVCDLKSTYRWCLTGTPIFNGLMDIYPYLRFLRIRPYNDIGEFRCHIARQEKNNPNLATKRAQAVLATCMMRRQKDSKLDGKPLIVLPPKTVTDVMLHLSPDERDIYDMLEKQAQRKFNVFLRRGTVLKNFACILVLLLRLRQACGHPALTIEEGDPDAGAEVDPSFAACFLDPYSEHKRAMNNLGHEWVTKTKQRFLKENEELVKMEKEDPDQAAAPECPICSDALDESSRITACGHVFCQGCLETLFTQTDPIISEDSPTEPSVPQKNCPSCRTLFRQSDTYLKKAFLPSEDDDDSDGELPGFVCMGRRKMRHGVIDDSDEEDASTSSPKGKAPASTPKSKLSALTPKGKTKSVISPYAEFVPSTKLVWMLEEIIRVKKEFPTDKTIVISQWTSMLGICGSFLHEQGHRYVQYQGDMSSRERDEAVNKFKRMPHVSIMLMSLKCGGVGLNLTCANRVISLDLAWSPSSERQAFDRTHRLGQMKNVFITRVMIENSVEQRICNLQRKKQDLSDNALGDGTGKKLKRLTVGELASLFNLNVRGEVLS